MSRTDNFNRADSTSGIGTPSDGGSAWQAGNGNFGISSNRAYSDSVTVDGDTWLESSLSDCDVQATYVNLGGNGMGLIARLTDASNYILLVVAASAQTLYRVQAAGYTSLGSSSRSLAGGNVALIHLSGSSITVSIDGTTAIGPVTETFNQSATKHGLYAYQDTAGRVDDFSVAGPATGGPFPFFLDQPHSGGFSDLGY